MNFTDSMGIKRLKFTKSLEAALQLYADPCDEVASDVMENVRNSSYAS